MGTWGVGPFHNDDACDMVVELMHHVDLVVDRKSPRSARYHYNAARAAAQFVALAHGSDILGGTSIRRVLEALCRIRRDGDWLSDWQQPKKIARALDREILSVLSTMSSCKSCRRAIKKPEWSLLRQLAEDARESPVPRSNMPARKRGRR